MQVYTVLRFTFRSNTYRSSYVAVSLSYFGLDLPLTLVDYLDSKFESIYYNLPRYFMCATPACTDKQLEMLQTCLKVEIQVFAIDAAKDVQKPC